MTRRITTENAVIRTAAVEVKTLTVSGKQVTLAVFRQLMNDDVVDPVSCQLRGVPWGTVNYFFGDCKADHLHVVWQSARELRRSCVFPKRPRTQLLEESSILSDIHGRIAWWSELAIIARAMNGEVEPFTVRTTTGAYNSKERHAEYVTSSFYTATFSIELSSAIYRWVAEAKMYIGNDAHGRASSRNFDNLIESLDHRRSQLISAMNEPSATGSIQELDQQVESYIDMYSRAKTTFAKRDSEWSARYQELAALDQLFIAV